MNELPVQNAVSVKETTCRWWNNLLNASEDAQVVCRSDGIAVQINPRAERLFRLIPGSGEGSFSVCSVLAAPADQKLVQFFKSQSRRADTIHSVMILRCGLPHVLMDLELVPLGDGFALVTFKDSSHRVRLESHVQRLVTAIDATPAVFLVTDAELRISFVNPAFQTVTGYGIEEVLGRSDEFLRAPAELERVLAYREAVTQGREWTGEFINLRRNGETYHAESTISPIADLAGRFVGYVVCERDITVRKQLEDALRAERDFVHSILQSLDGAIYSLDCEFRLTHANDGWRLLPGEHGGIHWNDAPAVGCELLEFVPDAARRAELKSIFKNVLSSGKAQDNHFHAPDGRHWVVKISTWVNGLQTRGLICNISDQSQYHELQSQLFQAQKMEIIGTLAAGVAHDFNNLLQVIRGHASLVLMQATPESPLRMGLERIDMAAARAAEITKQLLSFSRVSEERRIVLDLNKVIKETSQLARKTLRGNVEVDLRPAPKSIRVKMDPTKASQALLNLCVNAQDAMPDGGLLTLTNSVVELSPDLAQRYHLQPGAAFARCSVADTGCGIPPEVVARIFEPFFTTKAKGKGTGLGLSIVRRVAEEAGGFIEVDTTLDKGTTFHLYIPLELEQAESAAAPEHQPLAHGKGRVLVVDDVDLLRDFTQNFLQMAGLNVLVASSGQQALKVLEESSEPVDLVFTDYNMPGMTGLDLIEAVASRWPASKFVLASGFLDDETYARIECYNVTILAKPYDMYDASKIVIEKLAEKKSESASAARVSG